MHEFKVGDTVVGNGVESGLDITGMVGRVMAIRVSDVSVEFENEHGAFHDCSGICKPNHGFYVEKKETSSCR